MAAFRKVSRVEMVMSSEPSYVVENKWTMEAKIKSLLESKNNNEGSVSSPLTKSERQVLRTDQTENQGPPDEAHIASAGRRPGFEVRLAHI
jgi:hypothetical protein